jgi:Flp pilus assembly protein TadG
MRGYQKNKRRRGVAVVYVVVVLGVMLGFCSLAVDLGRVQTGKTELRRAADSAARAAIANLYTNTGPTQAAISIAAANKCDGSFVTLTSSNVQVGIWDKNAKSFSTSGSADNVTKFSAVQVTTSQSIPLLFGMVIGRSSCTVNASSVAALVSVTTPLTEYVAAHGNPWLAGAPAGTQGSEPDDSYTNNGADQTHPWKYDIANPSSSVTDTSSTVYTDSTKVNSTDYQSGEPWASPTKITVAPGSVLQISVPDNSSNQAQNDGFLTGGSGSYYASGADSGGAYHIYSDDAANPNLSQGTQTTSGSENGISNIEAPLNSLIGVFTDGGVPSTEGAAPSGLDFSTQTNRDYTSLEPKMRQSFYVGDGTNSSNQTQTIIAPNGATTLYLGTMDGHEWSNNVGGYNATITEFNIELVH